MQGGGRASGNFGLGNITLREAAKILSVELNQQLVHDGHMKYSKENSKSRVSFVSILAALILGACASSSDKTGMTDTRTATDSGEINTEVVTANSALSESGPTSTLILKVSGYKVQSGQIMVAVFNSEAAFDSEGEPFRDAKVSVDSAQTSITFGNLPAGNYAFKVFHDANGNGKLDTNAFGMPTEKYAFSLDASDPFSAPEWVESHFSLSKDEDVRTVSLD